MRKKGFTVIELVVSMALTSMVMILLFNMIFSLKDLYINAVLKTELLNKQTIMNQNLNKLLAEKEVKGLYECGKDCLRFVFADRTNTKLEIDKKNKTFSVGNYKTKLVSGSEFGDIKLLTTTIEGVEEDKNDSYLTLEIPVKHSLLSNEEYGINTIYQYDMEAMDIGTIDIVDMAEKISELEKKITNLQNDTTQESTFLKTYPVGSIYITENSTNPGSTYGGTWEAYGTGRALVGVDTTQTEFNTVSKTGGAKTHLHSTRNHTLTIAEMPSHTHSNGNIRPVVWDAGLTNYTDASETGGWGAKNIQFMGARGTLVTNTGGGQAHNHGNTGSSSSLMPYITVYMWKRTN